MQLFEKVPPQSQLLYLSSECIVMRSSDNSVAYYCLKYLLLRNALFHILYLKHSRHVFKTVGVEKDLDTPTVQIFYTELTQINMQWGHVKAQRLHLFDQWLSESNNNNMKYY